jgi:putative tryptophan/tyrosine transport system substrate-binding protein
VNAATVLRSLILGVLIAAAHPTAAGAADEPNRVPRVGVMMPLTNSPLGEGLGDGLRELGYIDGKNIVLDSRMSGATDEELRSVAVELAREKADLIVVGSTPEARAALEATAVPVVFVVGDPIGAGFAVSFARPGGRATGVSILTMELAGKRLELLRLLVPKAGASCS